MSKRTKKRCTIEGCRSPHKARGWCDKHYQRWKAHRDPLKRKRIPTSSAEESFALRTEWQGDCLIWTGSKNLKGYGRIVVNGKNTPAHRYAWERVNGPVPGGMIVDHKDHCSTSCVNVTHLRLATPGQNNANRKGVAGKSKSGVRNVYYREGKWRVRIVKQGVVYNFGDHTTIPEAAAAAEQGRLELFGEFAGRG